MICYTLRCDTGHHFEAWFRSSSVFDGMLEAGQVTCTHCGSANITKAPMAPSVPTRKSTRTAPEGPDSGADGQTQSPVAHALAALRAHVEANSDYVGPSFASEARAIHEGRAPKRSIHGEARADEARKLIEDGVPVAPLPFIPKQRMN